MELSTESILQTSTTISGLAIGVAALLASLSGQFKLPIVRISSIIRIESVSAAHLLALAGILALQVSVQCVVALLNEGEEPLTLLPPRNTLSYLLDALLLLALAYIMVVLGMST